MADDNETLLDLYIWYEVSLGHCLQIISPSFQNVKIWVQNSLKIPSFRPKYVVQLLNDSKTLLDFCVRHEVFFFLQLSWIHASMQRYRKIIKMKLKLLQTIT